MSYWAIKTPTGKLITSSAREDRRDCYEAYVAGLLFRNTIPDRPEWNGLKVWIKHWRALRRCGFRLVRVAVCQMHDKHSGWSWPQLTEINTHLCA